MKFAFIEEHLADFPTRLCCRVLQVSDSGYYAWLKREPGERAGIGTPARIRGAGCEGGCVFAEWTGRSSR